MGQRARTQREGLQPSKNRDLITLRSLSAAKPVRGNRKIGFTASTKYKATNNPDIKFDIQFKRRRAAGDRQPLRQAIYCWHFGGFGDGANSANMPRSSVPVPIL